MKEMPRFAKDEVISRLRDLANARLQEEIWVEAKAGGPTSPAELVSQLFDDTALDEYLRGASDSLVFSPAVDALLREISEMLDKLDLAVSPKLLLREPQWLEVQRKAAMALTLIGEH